MDKPQEHNANVDTSNVRPGRLEQFWRSPLGKRIIPFIGLASLVGVGCASAAPAETPSTTEAASLSGTLTPETSTTITETVPNSTEASANEAAVLTETQFTSYAAMTEQAHRIDPETGEPEIRIIEQSELIITAELPSDLAEAVAILDQWHLNATAYYNFGWGKDNMPTLLWYPPQTGDDENKFDVRSKASSEAGATRVHGSNPDYLTITEGSNFTNFRVLSPDIFAVDGTSTVREVGDADPILPRVENGTGWLMNLGVELEDGSTTKTWVVLSKDQVIGLTGTY